MWLGQPIVRDDTVYQSPVHYVEFGPCLVHRAVGTFTQALAVYRYVVFLLQLTHLLAFYSTAETTILLTFRDRGGLEIDLDMDDNDEIWSFTVDNRTKAIDWRRIKEVSKDEWRKQLNVVRKKTLRILKKSPSKFGPVCELEAARLPFVGTDS